MLNASTLRLDHLTEILTPLKKVLSVFFNKGIIIIIHIAMVLNTVVVTGTPSLRYLNGSCAFGFVCSRSGG
jgi:transcriptional regulatory protein LevR